MSLEEVIEAVQQSGNVRAALRRMASRVVQEVGAGFACMDEDTRNDFANTFTQCEQRIEESPDDVELHVVSLTTQLLILLAWQDDEVEMEVADDLMLAAVQHGAEKGWFATAEVHE